MCESYGPSFRFGSREWQEAHDRRGAVDVVWSIADESDSEDQ